MPDPDHDHVRSEGLYLAVSAVARRLGVAPATLRTWDRRYGVGPSFHAVGRHRRYGPADVARLETMQQALVRGASAAEAARFALSSPPTAPRGELTAWDEAAHQAGHDSEATDQLAARVTVSGAVLRMPGASRQARGLARAVLSLDARSAQRLILDGVSSAGIERTWEDLVRPVMGALSRRWEGTGSGVELEHLLSECVTTIMSRAVIAAPPPLTDRPVLLGSVPGDHHCLPLRVLCATLAQRRVRTGLLGADLPVPALAAAIGRTGPAAVFMWAQVRGGADPEMFQLRPRTRIRTRCFVGGPAWEGVVLPPSVLLVSTLAEAGAALSAAAGG